MTHRHDAPRCPMHMTDGPRPNELDLSQNQVARHAAAERAITGMFEAGTAPSGERLCINAPAIHFEVRPS